MDLFRGGRFGIVTGDITKLSVDAIVNSTNPGFARGFGVDAAIHEAAGPELLAACAELGTGAFGDARITPGFRLPAKHVVHVVAPVWRGGDQGELEQLGKTYRAALEVASINGVRTIAFPAISTGAYAFPFEQAAEVAVASCVAYAKEHARAFKRIVWCAFTPDDAGIYRRVAERHFAAGAEEVAAKG